MRLFKHLSFHDRMKIEAMLNAGRPVREIASAVHVHISTIYREIKRGRYDRLNSDYTTENRYSPDIAEAKYRDALSAKGAPLKIGRDFYLAAFIEDMVINEKYSPAAVLGTIKANGIYFETNISTSTLYNYIDKGVFLRLTNKNLPVKGTRKRKYRKVKKAARPSRGESIENRPEDINTREAFGHWEMDCVEGKKGTKKTLLVLTERKTRDEIVIPIRAQNTECVVAALDRLERKYGALFSRLFKSITVDNGSEFSDCAGMERSRRSGGKKRTQIYYCHPYSSWERGSNENQNKLIRRHFPKGTDLRKVPNAQIKKAEEWINNYPRKIFDFKTPRQLFDECFQTLL